MRRVAFGAATAAALAILLAAGCGRRGAETPAPPPPERSLPAPIFDRLMLGMTRADVAKIHPIRPSRSSSGRNLRVWIYERGKEYSAQLRFDGTSEAARLSRVDVHFGPSGDTYAEFVRRYAAGFGTPDVPRREAVINAYGDARHVQYETIWSDPKQYVSITERVPAAGGRGPTVYYLTVKRKEIEATGPPTGYVPPPAPLGKDGKPQEEPVF
jgi:hypothetical protein